MNKKWKMTPAQIISGEVELSLEDYFESLVGHVQKSIKTTKKESRKLASFFYSIYHYACQNFKPKEIAEIMNQGKFLINKVIDKGEGNIDILKAIIERMYINNLKMSKGKLSKKNNDFFVYNMLRIFHERLYS